MFKMKKTIFTVIVVMLVFASCKKETATPIDFRLIGKWIYKERGFSIGGPMIWSDATPANQVIEFKKDGTFISASNFLDGAKFYEKLDSATLKFTLTSNPAGYIKMGYLIDSISGKLLFWPVEPRCIEGCGYRFVKMN
jgi:hypothetical protein